MKLLHITDPKPWEDDKAVIQSLVFSDKDAFDNFESAYNHPDRPKTAGGFPDENNLGVMYKVGAVRCYSDKWIAVVRSGFNGDQLYQSEEQFVTWQGAIGTGMKFVQNSFKDSVSEFIERMLKANL